MRRELALVSSPPVTMGGPFAGLTEGQLARVLTTLCDVGEAPEGPLLWRLGVLTERLATGRAARGKASK